jgi:hypothetical protein
MKRKPQLSAGEDIYFVFITGQKNLISMVYSGKEGKRVIRIKHFHPNYLILQ